MLFSCRALLAGMLLLFATQVSASFHGSNSINNSRVTINAIGFYANFAKGFAFPLLDPTTVSSDGYPLNAPASGFSFSAPMPASYYGQIVWKFNGAASMQFAYPAIIYSGAGNVLNSSNVG